MSEFLNADELRGPGRYAEEQTKRRTQAMREFIGAAQDVLIAFGWTRAQLVERMERGRKEYGEFVAETDKRSSDDLELMILEEAADVVNYAGMGDAKEEAEIEQRRLDRLGDV